MPFSQKIPSNDRPANELRLASQSIQQPQPVCTWSALAPQSGSSPSLRRRWHTLTATANAASELIFFGGVGFGDVGANSDVFVFSTRDFSTTLRVLYTFGEVPTRDGHCAAVIGTTLLICGGSDARNVLCDDSLYLLNLETREWSHVVVNGPGPGGRRGHTANVVGSKLFIFGGQLWGKLFDDMWTLDLNGLTSQPVWESYKPTPGNKEPISRDDHVSVTTGDHIIIFGGYSRQGYCNDTWSFDISTRKWTELQCTGSIPSPRRNHAAVLVDGVMYVFGGYTGKNYSNELIALQLSTQRWFNVHNVGQSPLEKCSHAMASDGTHVFVHGGASPSGVLGELHVFDTKDIKYPETERNAVNSNEKTTQLPRARNSFTGPSTQVQPQHPTLEQQLSVLVSVQAERDEEFVDMQAKLDELLLSRDQQIGQYERKLEAVCLRLADAEKGLTLLDKLVVSHDQQVTDMSAKLEAKESELEAVRLRLTYAEKGLTLLDELVVSHDQQVGQHEKELTDMRAKLEAKESELEAVRLRPTDAGDGWARSKTRAGKLRTVTAASLIDLNEDRHECDPKEDKQVMEARLASPQWNEKNRDG